MENWTVILNSEDALQVSLAEAKLNENNIPHNVLNKRDSEFVMIGYIELYVPNQYADEAKKLIESL